MRRAGAEENDGAGNRAKTKNNEQTTSLSNDNYETIDV
jgi:hypothetical protein